MDSPVCDDIYNKKRYNVYTPNGKQLIKDYATMEEVEELVLVLGSVLVKELVSKDK